MEEFYKNKYLKYKQKYLEGGKCEHCPKIGFEQHKGECWHDSFSTIMLFSDDFSETIQKIFTPDFSADMRIRKVTSRTDVYPKYFLPPNITDTETDFKKFCEYGKIYLNNLFLLYQNELKPIDKRVDAEKISISCVSRVYDIININRIDEKKFNIHDHGGSIPDNIINACLYNYFLREPKSNYLILNHFDLTSITPKELGSLLELIPKCFGIYISLDPIDNSISAGHVTGFFSCKNKQYFFDNQGISEDKDNKNTFVEFQWKKYLTEKINKLLSDKDVTYSIISDFFTTHGKKYLKEYIISDLTLFISHKETTEDDYNNNNYKNYIDLAHFSTPKLNNLIIKYFNKEQLTTLLFKCVAYNNHQLLKEITKKFSLNLLEYKYNNMSLLFYAVSFAKNINETIKFLLSFKFDLHETIIDDITNYNIFLKAIVQNNVEFINMFLTQDKSQINSVTFDNESGLYLAIMFNSYDMVKLLIENGIDLSIKKNNEKSVLRLAIIYNIYYANEESYRLYSLESNLSKEKVNAMENELLDTNKKIIELLLNNGAVKYEKDITDTFVYALEYNNLEAVELLLSKKYNIPINVNAMIEGEPLISFLINYENGIIHHLNPRSILYQIIKSRDDQRNESIIDLILQKRPNKKTIICALDLCKKVAKPNISKKLLAIKI